MGFQFNRTYYAIVGRHGEVIAPRNAPHNGLYEKEAIAQRYLDGKIETALLNSKGNTAQNRAWAERHGELLMHKVVPIHVLVGEA
jgi:hypothetical protein